MSLTKAVSQKVNKDNEAKIQSIKDVTEEQTVRINFIVTKSMQKAFKAKALDEDTTMTELINGWISKYIDKQLHK
jgi:hypothetical protein